MSFLRKESNLTQLSYHEAKWLVMRWTVVNIKMRAKDMLGG